MSTDYAFLSAAAWEHPHDMACRVVDGWGDSVSENPDEEIADVIRERDDQHRARLRAILARRTDGVGNVDACGVLDDVQALVRRGSM